MYMYTFRCGYDAHVHVNLHVAVVLELYHLNYYICSVISGH